MKNKNTLLFIITSFVIISLFIYLGYRAATNFGDDKSINNSNLQIHNSSKDSLKNAFNTTIAKFDSALYNSTIDTGAALNISANDLNEYVDLKNEIKNILKDTSGTVDLELAKQKIGILEYKIEELKNRNTHIEADNRRLNSLIAELIRKERGQQRPENSERAETSASNSNLPKNQNNAQVNSVVLKAFQFQNDRKLETSSANNANSFEGSFVANTKVPGDFYVVLQTPTGEVLKNSDWESGVLKTSQGQRKIFSMMIRTEGNGKQVGFKLNAPENAPQGIYTLQVYHQGNLIATTKKTLAG